MHLLRTLLTRLIAATFLLACDGGEEEPSPVPALRADAGAGRDAGARDASPTFDGRVDDARAARDTATNKPEVPDPFISPPRCSAAVGSCAAYSYEEWSVLMSATDFGPTARLVAMDGDAVLVAVDGGFRVARQGLRNDSRKQWAVDFPTAAGARAIAIADTYDNVSVLTCDAAHARCSVRRNVTGVPTRQEEYEVPAGFSPRRLVSNEHGEMCVYGAGMTCLRGTSWHTQIAAEPDLRLNYVVLGSPMALAVGDHGRWFKRHGDPAAGEFAAWEEQAPLPDVRLEHASIDLEAALLVGEGRLAASLGANRTSIDCAPQGELVATWLPLRYRTESGGSLALLRSGTVLYHRGQHPEPYCVKQELGLAGAILDVAEQKCSLSQNPRVLTADALFGTDNCVVPP